MPSHTKVLNEWYHRASVTQRAHYLSADHFSKRKYWLGVPAVILATIVGTSVFAALSLKPDPWIQILIGLASVAAAVLTSLQTLLGYAERAEKHRLAGAKYGALGRELEEMLSSETAVSTIQATSVRERLDALALESPDNPQSIYYKAGAGELQAPGVQSVGRS
ncbi:MULTISPECIES: SLATT domain-containing protein [unclassified Acidovorax]|uniref:SLATT domain-containing protein n=1 Tax=unclassified Acidovorax TaxID=2684926 RepID=UPI00288332F8|nr:MULTISPECIES: SLATT domain-containing protein [unclassified Acidovorax]